MIFLFKVSNHFIIVVYMVTKTINIIFFSNCCSKSIFSAGSDGYNLSACGPFRWNKIEQIFRGINFYQYYKKSFSSGCVDITFLGFLEAAAVAIFAV